MGLLVSKPIVRKKNPFRKAACLGLLLCTSFINSAEAFIADERGMWGLPASFGIDVPHYVKSIQSVSITIAINATNNTQTINSVTTTNTLLIYQGINNNSGGTFSSDLHAVRMELTNATTITAYRNSSSATLTATGNAVAVEFWAAAVTGVQHGTVTLTAQASNTAAITSVTTSLSAVFFLGFGGATANNLDAAVTLTNSTTVTGLVNASMTGTIGFCVISFRSSMIQSIQQFSSAFTTANSADTQTITAVVMANSMIAFGGNVLSSIFIGKYQLQLTATTTVTLTRNSTSTTSRTPYYTVIEFKSGILKNSLTQRGSIDVRNVTNATAAITAVDTNDAFANFTGYNGTNGSSSASLCHKMTLTNPTTITASCNTSQNLNDVLVGYESIQFR